MENLQALSPKDDRRAGAILGLAVGDALGATYEFCSPDEVPEGPLEMVGGGWLDLEPGETTDDTALTRAVLKGYHGGSLDLHRVRDEMLRWQDTLHVALAERPVSSSTNTPPRIPLQKTVITVVIVRARGAGKIVSV